MDRRSVLAALTLSAGAAVASTALAAAKFRTSSIVAAGGRRIDVMQWKAIGRCHGTMVFSHGAGSAPRRYVPLIEAWQRAGFTVLAPLHMDSTDHPAHAGLGLMPGWAGRLEDVAAVAARMIPKGRFIAAGHSWGGLTALAMAGARVVQPPSIEPLGKASRVSCVLALSPPAPSAQLVEAGGYAAVRSPLMVQTGTADNVPDGDWRLHLAAYEQAMPGDKYAAVIDRVDHCFGGVLCRQAQAGEPQTAELGLAADVSIRFLMAYAAGDSRALRNLRGMIGRPGPVALSAR